ncbi:KNR4/SMI1 homolog [Nicotiana tomentosiformis]|uniref:KNR4/SMI1 homolog n=1 Tax=Nicotiana tomentosiformis TaxID=4098 RepID=UPI00388CB76A
MVDISEALRTEENAPSDSLGAIVIEHSPTLPAFSEGAIREARALGTLEVDGAHEGEDLFCDLFTGIEDTAGPSDASDLFFEVQRTLNRALALHQEEFSKSRAELSRREADFRGLSEERNALKLLSGRKEKEIKDLRAELSKAHQDETDMIEQEEGMDRLAVEKETARAQLSSVEIQLQGMKEKSFAQARKIEELETRLASEFAKAEKEKVDADAIVAVYRADAEVSQVQAIEAAETAQTRAHWVAELAKCQSLGETLEDIHARGFDLTEEILKAKELEANVGALDFDDDDDDNESGSESGEEPDAEETAPRDN